MNHMSANAIGSQIGDMLGSPAKVEDQVEGKEVILDNEGEDFVDEKTEGQEVEEKDSGKEEEIPGETEGEGTEGEGSEDGKEGEVEGEEDEAAGKEKTPVELEIEALRIQNELLQAQLNEVSEKRSATKEEDEEVPILDIGQDFVDAEDDLDALFTDHKKVNATLGKAASKAANVTLEHVFKKLPSLITKIVQDEVSNYRQADQFFADNKDLVPHRQFVSYVYNEMVQGDPETSPLDHFKGLAKEVRKRIGTGQIPAKQNVNKPGKRRSTFNPPGGRPIAPPKPPSGIGAEINKMLKV